MIAVSGHTHLEPGRHLRESWDVVLRVDWRRLKAALLHPEAPRVSAASERRAAVAMLLRFCETDAEILFIRRAARPGGRWSGQMAFPGGQEDPEDADLLHTAVRETREETAIELHPSACLGRLPEVQARTRSGPMPLFVTPFVFEVTRDVVARPNEEVAEVLWTSLSRLHDGHANCVYEYSGEDQPVEFPAFDVEGRIVWGLTYRMLQDLFCAMAAMSMPEPKVQT